MRQIAIVPHEFEGSLIFTELGLSPYWILGQLREYLKRVDPSAENRLSTSLEPIAGAASQPSMEEVV